ncbi:mitochondrial import receptor subunit TOM20 homolog [Drosophila obscura]|uniref:mitochondrial import receptor subunit TOM20 homolog n=1 Tax=Drosophila obscura TaxID=7282 RepID=UPI001BB1D447|nr:mitochondrial import receptor subunit TOM20 homolog [Drosophila obscura]
MLSLGSAKLLALGTAGALFLGYCFYFDRKRTSAPDYKKKVHERRRLAAKQRLSDGGRAELGGAAAGNEEADQLEMQLRFLDEVQRGEGLIKEGRVDEGLTHLCTAIMLCANPGSLLEMLQANLPESLFRPLMMRLTEMSPRDSSSEASSESTDQLSSSSSSATTSTSCIATSQPDAPEEPHF